jgi:hypothetical protein
MKTRAPDHRRVWAVALFGVVLAGCAGIDVLLQLGATVDLYFSSGDFAWDVFEAAHFVGKVLGSGMA